MKSSAAFLAAILLLVCLALPVAALESQILTVCEKNLYIGLGPSFEIERSEFDTEREGMISNDILINNTAELDSLAFISINTVYDPILAKMNPDLLAEFYLTTLAEVAREDGADEIGKWTAVDSRGRNVSVIMMKTADEHIQMPDGILNVSVWNLDSTTYALLISSFDEYNTTQLIKTLAVG